MGWEREKTPIRRLKMADLEVGAGGVQGPVPLGPIGPTPAAEKAEDVAGQSSVAKSDAVAEERRVDAGAPALPTAGLSLVEFFQLFYSFGSDAASAIDDSKNAVGTIEGAFQQQTNDIILSMLDQWLDSIEEASQARKEELNSPTYRAFIETQSPAYIAKMQRDTPIEMMLAIRSSAEFQQYVSTLPPDDRAQEIAVTRTESLRSSFTEAANSYLDRARSGDVNKAMVPFMAASFIIGAAMIGGAAPVGGAPGVETVSTTSVDQIWAHLSPMVPPAFQDASVIVINLFATGLIFQAAAAGLGNVAGAQKQPQEFDKSFAEKFAQGVLQQVSGNEIRYSMVAMMAQRFDGSQPVSHERIQQLVIFVKLVLLSMAIAALYKVETKRVTGREFADMVLGKMTPRSKEEKELVKAFQDILNSLPSKEKMGILEVIIAYIDSDPELEDLFEPTRVFKEVLMPIPNELDSA